MRYQSIKSLPKNDEKLVDEKNLKKKIEAKPKFRFFFSFKYLIKNF